MPGQQPLDACGVGDSAPTNASLVVHHARIPCTQLPSPASPENGHFSWSGVRKLAVKSDAGPIHPLPSKRWMISEAEWMALEAFTEVLRCRRLLSSHQKNADAEDPSNPEAEGTRREAAGLESWKSVDVRRSIFMSRKPEAHQVFRTIEDQDLGLLAEIAEHDFLMLLRPLSAGTNRTPLNHAIDCGTSHRGIALLLLGMFSRYVNHLADADFALPDARETLRLLRVNFALAMARGVLHADTTLAASFLQTAKADEIVASLEDYIGNATADLLAMAAWHSVCQIVPEELAPIPTHYFARDERVFNTFMEKLDLHRELIGRFVGKRLRAQLAVLRVQDEWIF
ncbi:hypothetical protein C8R44DRAFT_987300 [Mycena epipterygia]|nr:hypothetical protein C8R44DRAFT_987300 [Mycena epipterygia]